MQGFVIGAFALLDDLLNTDEFADDIAASVEQEQGEQAAHATVAVIERMDAEKVEDEHRDQQQRIGVGILQGFIVRGADVFDRFGRLPCRYGFESDELIALRVFFGDDVVGSFVAAADGTAAVFVEVAVELEDRSGLEGDVVVVLVDGGENVTVAGDFLLAAVAGNGFIENDLLDAIVRGVNALDLVGRLRALDLGNF